MSLKEAKLQCSSLIHVLCLQDWETSEEEEADAAVTQSFIKDTISCVTCADLAAVRVPPSRVTNLPHYHIPAYKTWTNRLLGLIGVSVLGKDYIRGQAGWKRVRSEIECKDKRLPDQLHCWMTMLKKDHLSEEWYKALDPAEASIWLDWLKDCQERVQAVSKRWGPVTAGQLIVS